MGDFGAQSKNFLDWFISQPGATFDSSLTITDLRGREAGRGIVANVDISAGTDLFVIPRQSIINVENSELSKKVSSLFNSESQTNGDAEDGSLDGDHDDDHANEMPRSWLNLILVLIYEYLQGEDSRWKSYLDVLPKSEDFTTLMFWTEQELDDLQASAVRVKIGKDSADKMFKSQILPIVKKHEAVFYDEDTPKLSNDELLRLAHRMGSLIMAYAFDLENEDDEQDDESDGWVEDRENLLSMGMVPMADMLNADAEFNAHLSHGEDTLTMTSLRPIKAGEEVLNYYGPLPNCELLRRYGYTSAKHARYDVVEISWDLVRKVLQEYWKAQGHSGQSEELPDAEESFVLEREAGDPDETGQFQSLARFTTFPEEFVEQVNLVNAAALGIDLEQPKVDKRRLKKVFLEVMGMVLEARQALYPTSIAEDEELLRNENTRGKLRTAIDVRLGEKKLLREVSEFVKDLQQRYADPASDEGGPPPPKKQKTSK